MDETGEPVRYSDQNMMTASGLDTLASASAESELAHSGNGESVSFNNPKDRRTSDPDEYSKLSSSPLSNDDDIERRAIMSEAFGTEFVRPGTLSEYNPTTSILEQQASTVIQPVVKAPSAKSISKPKPAGKVAAKTAAAKPKPSTAPSSSSLKRKKPANDSDSSDSEQQSPRDVLPSDSHPVPSGSSSSAEPQTEDVVIPQRALTVRERHRYAIRTLTTQLKVADLMFSRIIKQCYCLVDNFTLSQ